MTSVAKIDSSPPSRDLGSVSVRKFASWRRDELVLPGNPTTPMMSPCLSVRFKSWCLCRDTSPLEAIMNFKERVLVGSFIELGHDLDHDALALHIVESQFVPRSALRYDASSKSIFNLALQRFALLEVVVLFVERRWVEVGLEFVRIRIEFAIGKPSLHLSAAHFVVLFKSDSPA
jgi:hypothetical protein